MVSAKGICAKRVEGKMKDTLEIFDNGFAGYPQVETGSFGEGGTEPNTDICLFEFKPEEVTQIRLALNPNTRWLPMKDAPKNKFVLCTFERNADMAVLAFKDGEWRDCEGVPYYGPDYWLPLPIPPFNGGCHD